MPQLDAGGPADIGTSPAVATDANGSTAPGPQQTDPSPAQQQAAADRSSTSDLMDRLGIPAELHEQILGKQEPPAEPVADPEPSDGPAAEERAPEHEGEEEQDTEHEQEQPDKTERESAFRDPAVRQRIGKITKQREREKERADSLQSERDALQAKLEALEAKPDAQTEATASAAVEAGALANVRSEQELNAAAGKAEALLDWCDANAEGVTTSDDRFIDPQQIAQMRRNAERTLLKVPQKRQELRDFGAARQSWDAQAYEQFPTLFDKSSPDHSAAKQLLQAMPALANMPEANLVLGVFLRGKAAMEAGWAPNGAKPATAKAAPANPDLPASLTPEARRLRAQAPIAPITARPPSGNGAAATGRKQVDAAMQNVIANGGDRDSIAAAIGARMAADPSRTRNGTRQPIEA